MNILFGNLAELQANMQSAWLPLHARGGAMNPYDGPFDLNEEQSRAVERFCGYHRTCQAQADGGPQAEHAFEWRMGRGDGSLELVCRCGATLHVTEPIYVSIEPQRFGGGKAFGSNGRMASEAAGEAQEGLFQSALVTLPEDAFDQVRLHPSIADLHFGLGMHLRNRFVHSGLLWSGVDPDHQSSGAISKLIRHCIPEFRDYGLVYGELASGALYDAYRYCMEVRGEFPMEEFTRHYGILLEAQEIRKANLYSILDDEHSDEWRAWSAKAQERRKQYTLATLYEIWNFDAICKDLGDEAAKRFEEVCLAALHGERGGFMPSEVAYAMAGSTEERAMRAFAWAVEDYGVADYLPDGLFARRDLVLEAVGRRGRQLERAESFQDDDEVVLAAVADAPSAIEFASKRLQDDRRVLIEAASHADCDLIFSDGPMAKYNDDDELVGLAIDANGANIAYASERIRGSFDWAMRAVANKRDMYPYESYEGLSDELKQDKRIALAVAQWPYPPNEFPAITLIDDDDIGEALSQKSDRFALFGMSRRIKEKYMTEDELERWGDDPWWWFDDDEYEED